MNTIPKASSCATPATSASQPSQAGSPLALRRITRAIAPKKAAIPAINGRPAITAKSFSVLVSSGL
ncbi:MAG TPA: hypothetical protein VFY33_06630, partial [Solirubrobacterales bacterium]|nr:hypothetical protein [Solirubrobacterales bacterium]